MLRKRFDGTIVGMPWEESDPAPKSKGLRFRNDARSEAESVPLLFAWTDSLTRTQGQMRKFVISKAEFELGLKELALDLVTMDVDAALNLFHGRLLERAVPIKTKYDN
jgi:hypothetical protein